MPVFVSSGFPSKQCREGDLRSHDRNESVNWNWKYSIVYNGLELHEEHCYLFVMLLCRVAADLIKRVGKRMILTLP